MTPSLEELAAVVGGMQDRAAIWDCLQRYARGVDRFDPEIIKSAFHPDAIDDHGKFVGGPDEFVEWAIGQHTDAHLSHLHNLFNHTCDLDGDEAHTETYFMFAAMNREGPPLALGGGRYLDRFQKRDGEWRIAYRTCMREWGLLDERPDPEDLSSFTSTRAHLPDAVRTFMNGGMISRRDGTDPSYMRPLVIPAERLEAYVRLTGGASG